MEDLNGAIERVDSLSAADLASMTDMDREKVGSLLSGLVPKFPEERRRKFALSAVSSLPPNGQQAILKRAIQDLPKSEQESLAATMPLPGDGTRDHLWKVVVQAFAIVLVGSFFTLALGVFLPQKGIVEPAIVLSMFTSVVGFLAGLFVPSPATRNAASGTNHSATPMTSNPDDSSDH